MGTITLEKGLIAIGGLEGEGKTTFCLKIANHLAESEKVLFVNYQDYSNKLNQILEEFDDIICENLIIRTDFEYFGIDSFVELMQELEINSYSTIIIDNSDFLNKYDPWDNAYGDVDEFVKAMAFLTKHFKIRVIFSVNIGQKVSYSRKYPMLKDFNSSRHIPNKCDQILAIYRPIYHGYTENQNGNINNDLIDVYDLKNKQNTTVKLSIQKLRDYKFL